jgi:hypothetical protein
VSDIPAVCFINDLARELRVSRRTIGFLRRWYLRWRLARDVQQELKRLRYLGTVQSQVETIRRGGRVIR